MSYKILGIRFSKPKIYLIRLLLLSVLVGITAGLGALVFYLLLSAGKYLFLGLGMGYFPAGANGEKDLFPLTLREFTPWLVLIIPFLGGLLSGLIIYKFAPETEGHGTDSAIFNYHHRNGNIKVRTPLVKTIVSVLTIGSGGSGGQEGPIAQIGSGIGSNLAKILGLSNYEKRTLMSAGMAGGIGAIFGAPMAGALFAAEVLYQDLDFEYEILIPASISSIIANGVFSFFLGNKNLFIVPEAIFGGYLELIPYSCLSIVIAIGAIFFTKIFYKTHGMFRKAKFSNFLKPALGGFFVGIIAFLAFQIIPHTEETDYGVLATGYGVVQKALFGELPLMFLVFIVVGKIFTTSFSIASGGSGGVFGPSVVIGGSIGGAFGIISNYIFPYIQISPAAFVIIGIAGFFSAAANTPISTILMVSEITGNFELLVPAMWVSFLAYLIASKTHLYENQIKSRFYSPVHHKKVEERFFERT